MNRIAQVKGADPEAVFRTWLDGFSAAVEAGDGDAIASSCGSECYLKDMLALEWDYSTHSGAAAIRDALLAARSGASRPTGFRTAPGRSRPAFVRRSGRDLVEGFFAFETRHGVCDGFVRLHCLDGDPGNVRIWMLLLSLNHLHGAADRAGANRPSGDRFSQITSPVNWLQEREAEARFDDRDPQVVIVGAGQGGLMLAARLRQMGVDALVIERTARIGDVWRERYNNLTLHNELTANHFPYLDFPSTWPMWLPKDMLAAWLESYADFLELNVWTGTELVAQVHDPATGMWTITLRRPDGSLRHMTTPHLVAALGVSGGAPRRPSLPGLDGFAGTVLHSGEFRSGIEWAGRNALVVGTGNSGHDVAQDLHVSGAASVSIMQRGPTCVVSLEPSAAISYSVFAEGRPVEDVDLMIAAIPYPVLIDTYRHITRKTTAYDRALLDGLHAAGFRTWSGEDETGFQLLYLRGAGGYYIDVGCARLIAEGYIPVVQAEAMDRFVPEGVRMQDGTVIPLDLVVLATGFEGMQGAIRQVFGPVIAERVGPVWGFDEAFNMRNMWKRTAQPGFWIMGGAITEARLFSRYLALQIKASLDGLLPA